jgi:hypothetical protein
MPFSGRLVPVGRNKLSAVTAKTNNRVITITFEYLMHFAVVFLVNCETIKA